MNYIHLLYKLYRFKRNEKKSRTEILQLQDNKLRNILEYAFEYSPYYQRVFKNAGITYENIEDLPLSAFPKMNKETFVKNFDEIVTESDLSQKELQAFDEETSLNQKTYKRKYHLVHSSGSTGHPTYYIYDQQAWNEMLSGILRAALWNMSMKEIIRLLFSGPRIVYIAATDGRYGGAMAVGAGIEGIHAQQLSIDINQPVSHWIKQVVEFQPNIIIGYPSAIKILAELVEKKEIAIKVKRVISCGEPLNPRLREYLEKVLQATLINIYGASESLAIGVESSLQEGMYLFDDLNYIEVEDGHMYLTSLYNYAQPLIRYQISDCLTIKENENKQYPFTLIENVLGRNEDILWFENDHHKDFIHPLAIEGFHHEGMLDYQFHQTNQHAFEIWIQVTNDSLHQDIKKYMHEQIDKILTSKNLTYVQFQVKFVNEIYPDLKTGKKRLMIKECVYGRESKDNFKSNRCM